MAWQAAGGGGLESLEPVPTLLKRVRLELPAEFSGGAGLRVSRAPGRLDVMGGIADYTGSLVCEATLDRAAAVALWPRADRQVHVFSLNLKDDNVPFSSQMSLEVIAGSTAEQLRVSFGESGNKWAGYLIGCLKILQEKGLVDLNPPSVLGLNLAVLSSVPLGGGVSSSAAIEVATMMNLCGHFGLLGDGREGRVDKFSVASMCQEVENRIVGAPCGIMDQVASCCGEADSLMRLLCQPHEMKSPLKFPAGIRAVGIDSRVKHSVGGPMYGRTRCAAFMGHRIILEKMRQMGVAAGRTLESDPMRGYLANLPPDDYKKYFRPYLPESIEGKDFLATYGSTIDKATTVDPAVAYHVQKATDHHVLEANRVRNFSAFLQAAGTMAAESAEREKLLNKAGHLMYGSHQSYTNDAMMGADECDLLVKLVRQREREGLYGAKITGGGCGGTVAVLCRRTEKADAAIAEIMAEYQRQTGNSPQALMGSSPGAWQVGTAVL